MNAEFPVEESDLCSLIGSRICHDLVSPVGAIGNGVELLSLTDDGSDTADEVALIAESVGNAQARLRFYRIAFGQAGEEQGLGRVEVLGILTELYETGRLKVHWSVEHDIARMEGKLAFLLLMCLESAMPYGGQVHISQEAGHWQVHGEAAKLRLDPLLWEALGSGTIPSPLRPSQVQFGLLPPLLRKMGRVVTVSSGETAVNLRA